MNSSNRLFRWITRFHIWLYEKSNGRIGSSGGGQKMLLLYTIGRKSGVERTNPLMYLEDGDTYVISASNSGQDNYPGWWYNLTANPNVKVRVGANVKQAAARQADANERPALWEKMTARNPLMAAYQEKTEREIPLVILTPKSD